ncbi:MAG: hypothetical protein K1060chlam5_00490 [Candidatus Anoxychlamydiales bacterium]|nr:hypothetical protein [Candidatus Anoxychlamydiales bacterium]
MKTSFLRSYFPIVFNSLIATTYALNHTNNKKPNFNDNTNEEPYLFLKISLVALGTFIITSFVMCVLVKYAKLKNKIQVLKKDQSGDLKIVDTMELSERGYSSEEDGSLDHTDTPRPPVRVPLKKPRWSVYFHNPIAILEDIREADEEQPHLPGSVD